MNRENFGQLEGKLTRAPYWLRNKDGNIFMVKFTLCVPRGYRSKKDNKMKYDYPEVHFTGSEAQFAYLEEVLQPGVFVKCLFSLQTESYQLDDGSTKYVTYAQCEGLPSVRNIEFIPYKRPESENEESKGEDSAMEPSNAMDSQNVPKDNPAFDPQMAGKNGAMPTDMLAKGFQDYLTRMGIEMPSGMNPNMMSSMMSGMMSGTVPGMMPNAVPGMMQGAIPGMMPNTASNMMPGAVPGMMPNMGQGVTFPGQLNGSQPKAEPKKSSDYAPAWEVPDPFVPLQDTEDLPFK